MRYFGLEETSDPDYRQMRRHEGGWRGLQERQGPGMTQAATVLGSRMLVRMLMSEGFRLRRNNGTNEQEQQKLPRTSA